MPLRQRSFFATALFWCVASAPLMAQHPQVREGFWIGFGFGGGSAKFDCDSCASSNSEDGFAGFLKMGGTVSPHVLIGGESNGWTKEEGGVTTNVGNVSATIYYYPKATGGFFLRGGFGFAAYSASGGGSKLTGAGLGFTLGLGYDFRVARNFSLSPVLNVSAGTLGELKLDGNPSGITGATESVAQVGLGFTWH